MKWFVSWSCVLLCAFMAFGAEVSSEEARRAVGTWLALDGPMGCPAVASGVMEDVRTYEGKDGVGKFHVASFKKADGSSGGYVVTSAETTLTPILAYSEDGEFIESDENPLWVMLTFDVKAVTEVAQRQKGKVRYHKNDGTTEVANQTFKVGEKKSLCWTESVLGWTVSVAGYRCMFLGWAKSPTGAIIYSNGQPVADLAASGATLHLYAVWRVNFVESNCSNLASNKLLCYSAGVANLKECGTVRTKDGGQFVFDDSGTLLMMFEPDGTEHVIEGRFVMPAGVLKR